MKLSLEPLAVFSRSLTAEGEGTRAADGTGRFRAIITSNLTVIGGGASSASEVPRVIPRRGAKRVTKASPRSATRLLGDIEDVG